MPVPTHLSPLREEEKCSYFSVKKITELLRLERSLSSLRPNLNPAVTNPLLSPVPSGCFHASSAHKHSVLSFLFYIIIYINYICNSVRLVENPRCSSLTVIELSWWFCFLLVPAQASLESNICLSAFLLGSCTSGSSQAIKAYQLVMIFFFFQPVKHTLQVIPTVPNLTWTFENICFDKEIIRGNSSAWSFWSQLLKIIIFINNNSQRFYLLSQMPAEHSHAR